ncbi:hypothetical protein KI387_024449, partial [Taxus chinensis]
MTLEEMHMRMPNSHDIADVEYIAAVEKWREIENMQIKVAVEEVLMKCDVAAVVVLNGLVPMRIVDSLNA